VATCRVSFRPNNTTLCSSALQSVPPLFDAGSRLSGSVSFIASERNLVLNCKTQ
jgi:hypothetical protein